MATHCPRHPGVPTTDLCIGCGEFVCGQCAYVASDQRVFCPDCRERLSAEELSAPAPQPGPGRPPAPARLPRPPARSPVEPLAPLPFVPAAEVSSPVLQALKSSPIAALVLLMGIVGFGCFPVAVFGAAMGAHELKRHFTGTSHGHGGLVIAAFATNMAAILLRMAMWRGR